LRNVYRFAVPKAYGAESEVASAALLWRLLAEGHSFRYFHPFRHFEKMTMFFHVLFCFKDSEMSCAMNELRLTWFETRG
jgi:hypothetical protein